MVGVQGCSATVGGMVCSVYQAYLRPHMAPAAPLLCDSPDNAARNLSTGTGLSVVRKGHGVPIFVESTTEAAPLQHTSSANRLKTSSATPGCSCLTAFQHATCCWWSSQVAPCMSGVVPCCDGALLVAVCMAYGELSMKLVPRASKG